VLVGNMSGACGKVAVLFPEPVPGENESPTESE